jgi:hypothetical protein
VRRRRRGGVENKNKNKTQNKLEKFDKKLTKNYDGT